MHSESTSSKYLELLASVSEVYLQSNMTLAQIARGPANSRSMISRTLTKAPDPRAVEINIKGPPKHRLDLEAVRQTRFKLKRIH